MANHEPSIRHFLLLSALASLLCVSAAAGAQTTRTQVADNDVTRGELASFDHFMDSHPEIAEQLRKDPSLVRNPEFVENHPALQEYLTQHPEVREELGENPNRFMHQEGRFDRTEDRRNDRREDDVTRRELASFDRFLDSHREIAEQVRKDPSLAKNPEFVENHPALREYLTEHPVVREEIGENPNGFMRQEDRFDRAEDRRAEDRRNDRPDNDVTRRELGSFDHFMDSHEEIAEQLRKDPSLVKNDKFVHEHPALQDYLHDHPGVREEISENPNSFMHQEQRFDRNETWRADLRDHGRGETEGFGHFLGEHSGMASELSRNPSLANNQEYVANHPDLQQYLKDHPVAQKGLQENPQTFMQSATQFSTGSTTAPKTPALAPQLKPQK